MDNKWLQSNEQPTNYGAKDCGEDGVENILLSTGHHVESERDLVLVISQQEIVGHLLRYGDARLPLLIPGGSEKLEAVCVENNLW